MQMMIEVWGERIAIEVYQRSKSVWMAQGSYLDQHVQTTDRTAGAAAKRWREAVRYQGG